MRSCLWWWKVRVTDTYPSCIRTWSWRPSGQRLGSQGRTGAWLCRFTARSRGSLTVSGWGPPQCRAHGTSSPCDGLSRPRAVCLRSRAHSPGGGRGWTPTSFPARSPPTGAAPRLRVGLAFCLRTKSTVSLFTRFRLFHHWHCCFGTDMWLERWVWTLPCVQQGLLSLLWGPTPALCIPVSAALSRDGSETTSLRKDKSGGERVESR